MSTPGEDGCIREVRQAGATTVVRLGGHVDMYNTPDVHRTLTELCAHKPAKLVINLEKVSRMDSSGLGALVEVLRRVHAYNGRLALCGVSKQIHGLFEISRLDKFFTIHATEAEAVGG